MRRGNFKAKRLDTDVEERVLRCRSRIDVGLAVQGVEERLEDGRHNARDVAQDGPLMAILLEE